MSQFTIEIKGLDRLNNALRVSPKTVVMGLTEGIKTSVNIIRPLMVRNAPVKTSKLRRNIYARSSGLKGEVGPNLRVTPYALYVHNGTGPYTIRPKDKKALFWPGARHPVKFVNHPGIKANPFVERTTEEARIPINRVFQNVVNRIIAKIIKNNQNNV